jgi:hypothetical protein
LCEGDGGGGGGGGDSGGSGGEASLGSLRAQIEIYALVLLNAS